MDGETARRSVLLGFDSHVILRNNDSIYGWDTTTQLKRMGIEDLPTAPRSPWQNPYIKRLIGTVRRECLDHLIVLNERHLSRVLTEFVEYTNESRTHLSLAKDCPVPRKMERPEIGPIKQRPMVGGLHHRYYREAA